jgi:hypothetical protein
VVHDVTTVFHLGAQTLVQAARRDPVATFETNVRGTWNVLDVARRHPDLVRRVVVASSDKAYGASDDLPYGEDHPLGGRLGRLRVVLAGLFGHVGVGWLGPLGVGLVGGGLLGFVAAGLLVDDRRGRVRAAGVSAMVSRRSVRP